MSKYFEENLSVRTSFIGKEMTGENSTKTTSSVNTDEDDELVASDDNSRCRRRDDSRKPSMALMKIKTYLSALRPWSLSASLVPTLLGSAIAYRSFQDFNLLTFVTTIFTIISVHCAGNVVNTYFDYVKGIDNRKSDDRTLVDHILSKDEVSWGNCKEF